MKNTRSNPSKNLYLLFLLLLSSLVGCTSTAVHNSVYVRDITMQPDAYIKNFKEIHNIVVSKHKHLEHKGIKADSLFARYAVQISQAESKEQYGRLLLKYFAELRNGHTNVFFTRDFIYGGVKLVENRLFINSIADERLTAHGVQAKDEIITIDGLPVLEWIEQEKLYVNGSTEQGRITSTVSNLVFSSYFGGERQYGIQTVDDFKEITVPFDDRKFTSNSSFSVVKSKSISDSVGYVAINGMRSGVVIAFVEQYKDLKDKPYLIVDIRNNGGGNSALSEQIASYLIKQKHTASVSRRLLEPTEDSYKGKLFLLTSQHTFSAAESFAIDLKEAGDAIIVGEPTLGDTGNGANAFGTRQGISFRIPTRKPRFSAGGFPMEGAAIEPTHLVSLTVEEFMAGKDAVLDYTLNLIQNSTLPSTSQVDKTE
jgi:carboxyl-terminal processing protease